MRFHLLRGSVLNNSIMSTRTKHGKAWQHGTIDGVYNFMRCVFLRVHPGVLGHLQYTAAVRTLIELRCLGPYSHCPSPVANLGVVQPQIRDRKTCDVYERAVCVILFRFRRR